MYAHKRGYKISAGRGKTGSWQIFTAIEHTIIEVFITWLSLIVVLPSWAGKNTAIKQFAPRQICSLGPPGDHNKVRQIGGNTLDGK